jgi:hypothetical protein
LERLIKDLGIRLCILGYGINGIERPSQQQREVVEALLLAVEQLEGSQK